jgi:hypothetical protein
MSKVHVTVCGEFKEARPKGSLKFTKAVIAFANGGSSGCSMFN